MELAGSPHGGARPVFVDRAGRRGRRVALAGRVVAAGAVLYVGLFVASLVGASWVPPVGLPGVSGAPSGRTGAGRLALPSTAKVQPAPDLSPPKTATTTTPPGGARSGGPIPATPTTAPTGTTAARPTTTVPSTSTTLRSQRRTTTTTTPGATTSTSTPGRSGTAPGHGHP